MVRIISFLCFFDTCFFTSQISEIVNSCASYFTFFVQFDFLNCRKVYRENSFYPYLSTHLTDGESFGSSCSFSLNNHSSEELSSGFSTLRNFIINGDGISRCKSREFFFSDKFVFYVFN